jgi:hypothetical protein
MSDDHASVSQDKQVKLLESSSALFGTVCTFLAYVLIIGAVIGGFIGLADLGITALLAAVPAVLAGVALLYFTDVVKSHSAITIANFEMLSELKRNQGSSDQ